MGLGVCVPVCVKGWRGGGGGSSNYRVSKRGNLKFLNKVNRVFQIFLVTIVSHQPPTTHNMFLWTLHNYDRLENKKNVILIRIHQAIYIFLVRFFHKFLFCYFKLLLVQRICTFDCNVLFASSQNNLEIPRGMRQGGSSMKTVFWKKLVMNSPMINRVGNTTWQPKFIHNSL